MHLRWPQTSRYYNKLPWIQKFYKLIIKKNRTPIELESFSLNKVFPLNLFFFSVYFSIYNIKFLIIIINGCDSRSQLRENMWSFRWDTLVLRPWSYCSKMEYSMNEYWIQFQLLILTGDTWWKDPYLQCDKSKYTRDSFF